LEGDVETFLDRVAPELGAKLVLLFRRNELEEIQMPLEQRCKIIEKTSSWKSWLDLDVSTQAEELAFVAGLKTTTDLIASYHNYRKTPSAKELEQIVVSMENYKADIYKFSCLCHDVCDALTLMELGRQLNIAGKRCIVLGMGEYGLMTRVFGTLYWNEMIFAPLSARDASAPGQITRDDLEQILMRLSFGKVANGR
ncbi:MAG: type I 3-dehydroquinate dehydratase, partial [Bdellovibrionales bacterium]|nr:type I 3-dehydroquinate dehydratase [Bdellovibrionales bacterium]